MTDISTQIFDFPDLLSPTRRTRLPANVYAPSEQSFFDPTVGKSGELPKFAQFLINTKKTTAMAIYLDDVSRTFGEYLLIPGLTTK